jgi:hypothetical protein
MLHEIFSPERRQTLALPIEEARTNLAAGNGNIT